MSTSKLEKVFLYLKEKREYIPVVIMCIMVSLPMFFRGLYFEYDRSMFGIFASLLAGILFLSFKSSVKFNLTLDSGVTALTAIYGISILMSVNKGNAILGFMTYIMLIVFYFAVKKFFNTEEKIKALILTVCYAVGLTALISLLTATKVLNFPAAYSSAETERWLNGTLQYHNAFGIMTLAGFLGLSGISENNAKKWQYWTGIFVSYILFFGLIMSYSRGAWVVAPAGVIVYLIFASKENRIMLLSRTVTALIAVSSVLSSFQNAVYEEKTFLGVAWLIIGGVIMYLLGVMLDIVLNLLKDKKHFTKTLIIIASLAVAGGIVVVLFPGLFSAILPENLISRLEGINFTSQTVVERFVFYKDGFNMSLRNVILGSGAGSWEDLYGMYQSYDYVSKQAHSYFIQILTEAGYTGILAYLFIIAGLVMSAVKIKKAKLLSNGVSSAILSFVSVILVHSLIDFDLSLMGVSVVLWAFMAVISLKSETTVYKNLSKGIFGILVAVLFVFSFTNAIGTNVQTEASNWLDKYLIDTQNGANIKKESYEKVFDGFSKASSLKPYDAKALSGKALSRALSTRTNGEQRQLAMEEYEKAVKLAPYSFDVKQDGMQLYSEYGAYNFSIESLASIVKSFPKQIDYYLSFLDNAYTVMNFYRSEGVMNMAGEVSKTALEIQELAKENGIELPEETKQYFNLFRVVYNNTIRGTEKE